MGSLGAYLRERRTRRNVSLEEMARATRVAPRYLEALEADNAAALPAPTFTRGFIRAYCQFLGEPPDEALALYDRGDRPRAAASVRGGATSPTMAREPDGARNRSAVLVSFVLLVVLGIALFTVTLVIHPGGDDGDRRSPHTAAGPTSATGPSPAVTATSPPAPIAVAPPQPLTPPAMTPAAPKPGPSATAPPATGARPAAPAPSAPPNADAPAPASGPILQATVSAPPLPQGTPVPAPQPPAVATRTQVSPPPSPGVSAPDLTAVANVASPYRLVARTRELTWLRVRTSDGRLTEENIPADEVREYVSNQPFVITVGNAGGITLELNGRALPALGGRGAVVHGLVVPPPGR